jgi:hypothetical protein
MEIVSTTEGTLDREVVKKWCKEYHYAKRVPQISQAFGLMSNGELECVLVIGKPASNALCEGICGKENKSYVYELNRICAKGEMSVPLSQFVGKILKDLPNRVLVSYADTAWHHVGYIYQATNWLYTGLTRARTDINTKGHSRHYEKAESYPDRVPRSAKHRYVIFTGDKRFKKKVGKDLKYPIMQYPKGDIQRYEITE